MAKDEISPEEHAHYYTPKGCAQVRIPRGAFARQELIDLLSEAAGMRLADGFCTLCPENLRMPRPTGCRRCPPYVCYMPEHIAFIANAWIAQHDNV